MSVDDTVQGEDLLALGISSVDNLHYYLRVKDNTLYKGTGRDNLFRVFVRESPPNSYEIHYNIFTNQDGNK